MIWACTSLFLSTPMISPILDIVNPLNESRQKTPMYLMEFFIDEEKYFYEIYIVSIIFTIFTIFTITATDCLTANMSQHCEGLLKVLRWNITNILHKNNLTLNLIINMYLHEDSRTFGKPIEIT